MFPDAKLYFHETWEYEDKSTHPFFINYQNDPDAMYRAIDETCHAKAKEYELTLIPSGRAVHAAKQLDAFDPEKGGISLYRDKFHMGMIYGRYLVGCVWFKTITGKSPVGNRYIPTDTAEGEVVDAERIAQLQKVAANTFA